MQKTRNHVDVCENTHNSIKPTAVNRVIGPFNTWSPKPFKRFKQKILFACTKTGFKHTIFFLGKQINPPNFRPTVATKIPSRSEWRRRRWLHSCKRKTSSEGRGKTPGIFGCLKRQESGKVNCPSVLRYHHIYISIYTHS